MAGLDALLNAYYILQSLKQQAQRLAPATVPQPQMPITMQNIPQWGDYMTQQMMQAAGPGPGIAGRIGVLPGRERIASEIIKRGLKEPWFHGTNNPTQVLRGLTPEEYAQTDFLSRKLRDLARPGFDPSRIGSQTGIRLGEPAGVSLSRDPETAAKFGRVLRVGVDVPPSSVGQFVDPQFQELFREAYQAGMLPLKGVPGTNTPVDTLRAGVNQRMSDYLRSKGVEAIAYNPRRWNEFEMRVLDPARAVPLGEMPQGPNPVYSRYMYGRSPDLRTVRPTWDEVSADVPYGNVVDPRGLAGLLRMIYQSAPTKPSRLRDVLKDVAD